MFFKHLIRVLGCLFIIVASGVLLWLPSTPWATLRLHTPAASSATLPSTLSLNGYDGWFAISQMIGLTAMGPRVSQNAAMNNLVNAYVSVPTTLPTLWHTEQGSLQTSVIALAIWQTAFLILPLITIFLAIVLLVSHSTMNWQMTRGILLLLATLATVAVMSGGMVLLSQNFDKFQVDLQTELQTKLPATDTVDLLNVMNWQLALGAGIAALFGAAAALLGASLTASPGSYALPLHTQRGLALSNAAFNLDPSSGMGEPASAANEPISKTVRLTPKPCPRCGARDNSPNAKFCSKCGKAMP
jgi:ribosomal protein L40E